MTDSEDFDIERAIRNLADRQARQQLAREVGLTEEDEAEFQAFLAELRSADIEALKADPSTYDPEAEF